MLSAFILALLTAYIFFSHSHWQKVSEKKKRQSLQSLTKSNSTLYAVQVLLTDLPVKLKTAGAEMTTESPCGIMAPPTFSNSYPSGL